jgi:hypothetical protein
MTVALSAESEAATNSQWSQAASRVGILISGIPSPINSDSGTAYGYWGIGIINPLDRDVEIYSVGILNTDPRLTDSISGTGTEPSTGWRMQDVGSGTMVLWEGGDTPAIIPAKSVGQFRVLIDYRLANDVTETLIIIQALSSEGKLNAYYTISTYDSHPMINAFYTGDPVTPLSDWTYLIEGIPSGTNDQVFNSTVYNSSLENLDSPIKLIILVPSDFTDVKSHGSNTGWNTADIDSNPDGSHIIKVETTASELGFGESLTYQFSADAPLVNDDKLYVLQTTTVYPTFNSTTKLQLASALSEAGVEVVP